MSSESIQRERMAGSLSLCSLCALSNAARQSHCSVAMASAPNMLDELELQHDSGSAATATLDEVDLTPEREVPAKPQLRFYSVGPSTYRVLCPLCQQRARTETVQMAGAFGQLSCLLSVFSWCVCSSSNISRAFN